MLALSPVTLAVSVLALSAAAAPRTHKHHHHHGHHKNSTAGSVGSRAVIAAQIMPSNPKWIPAAVQAGAAAASAAAARPKHKLHKIKSKAAPSSMSTTASASATESASSAPMQTVIAAASTVIPALSVASSVIASVLASVTSTPAARPTPPSGVPTSPFKNVQSHSGKNFFAGWDYFSYGDPTHGQVNFLNQADSDNAGLTYITANGSAVMRVDDTTWLGPGQNRNSVRITSKQAVSIGSMVIMDAVSMPHGPGVWPAFWSVGPNWPSSGEIDIVEGVHENTRNQMTLHTSPGCTLSQPMDAAGDVLATTCDTNVNYNSGCGVMDTSDQSYGSGFNAAGGGVFVMYWDVTGISIWRFLRGSIPADITAGQPNFINWGRPQSRFDSGTCDMNQYFAEQSLVFDITLCGDWAGATYNQAGYSGSCSDAVANPTNFVNAAFEVNSVNVYKM